LAYIKETAVKNRR